MNLHRRTFCRAACLLLCVLLLCAVLPGAALAGQRQRVRVGFFAFDGYHMQDAEGVRSGYGYELLQHLAGYTDWEYIYLGYDKSWSEAQEMLRRGEIDLLTSAQKTETRLNDFAFSDLPIGSSSAILTARAGDETYLLEDYANWSGMRVGMIRGNSRNEDLRAFAANHGFTYEAVEYSDTETMLADLKAGGRIDAVVTSNLRAIDGEWVLAEFAPSPFYVMVARENTALLAEINDALEQLFLDEPGLREQLLKKYYSPDSGEEIAFTAAERAYVAAMRDTTFTALLNPDRMPLSGLADGQPTGILYEIAMEIIARSGLNIRFLPAADRGEYSRLVDSGAADIRFDAAYDYARAERQGYRLTVPYLDAVISRLFRRDNGAHSSVALLSGSDVENRYGAYFIATYDEAVYYESVDEVVEAVRSGAQDAAYLYHRTVSLAVRNDATNRLETEDLYGFGTSFAVAVSGEQDPLLFAILNKCVASIGPEEIERIEREYANYGEEPFSLTAYLYDYPLHVVTFVLAVLLVAALVLLLVSQSRKRRRESIRLAEEQRRSELLADALAVAERADTAKSQFLSRVSHEMRTPLNAILGFMNLSKGASPQEAAQYMTNSENAARQLLSVINDVLDMSAIESGKLKLAHAPFDLRQQIHELTALFLSQCTEKGLKYETKLLTPVDEWLVGDQLRLNQILMNLLGNAVKFTAQGHIWLSVSQTAGQDNRVFLRFEISDTGCGMSEELQTRLFRPFEQENAQTAQKYGGSGLGLSIVKNLVAMMDGAVRVESRVGEGTTFTVDLPFTRCETAALELPADAGHLRVLSVDDEPTERDYISTVLERIGIRHTCVADGDAALRELSAATAAGDPYNVCLVDWRLPEMNGMEVTQRVRAGYGKDMVVIVVSAYEHHQADERAREAGANLFLPKPLFQSALFDLFMTLTGGRLAKKTAGAEHYDLSGRRVLLAEDNAMNRMVAEGLLKKCGIVCDAAANGRIAVERFLASEPGHYDAILMDIQMPVMDGYEATRTIRESDHPDAMHISIIALTANAFNEDVARTLSSGMNYHVTKPIEPAELMDTLDKAFRRHSGAGAC